MIYLAIRARGTGFLGLKVKIWGHLYTQVIRADKCSFCGACIGVCPVAAIGIKDEKPSIVGRCIGCGYCYAQCPHIPFDEHVVEEKLFKDTSSKFGLLGYVRAVYAAKATDEEIVRVAQDGGVVTALLNYGLDSGLIECAVTSGLNEDDPLKPKPMLAFNKQDLLNSAGSKYAASPNLIALTSAVNDFQKESIGFVGVGCHITALRKMQYHEYGALKYGLRVKFAIGLFCSQTFYHSSLKNFLLENGINLSRITKTEIVSGRFKVKSGEETLLDVPLKKIKNFGRKSCSFCDDFTARLADISVGNMDSPEGWCTVIVRTAIGEMLFKRALEKGYITANKLDPKSLKLTLKMSKIKKRMVTEVEAQS